MHALDDASYVTRLDPKNMYGLTVAFADQCRRARDISAAAKVNLGGRNFSSVVMSGLGGSAAGGDFTKALFDTYARVPFTVNRDYFLTSWVGSETLVICASYSGNTEETLSAYADAKAKGATIAVVTSGGKLAELAHADGFPAIIIPGGQPPRTALGYMMVPVLAICVGADLLPEQDFDGAFSALDECVTRWGVEVPFENNEAKQLAQALYGKVSVLYGLGTWPAIVANRWKGQINENAKNMTFANVFPELNHNEILGWVQADRQGVASWVGILLEDGTESAKMRKRFEVTERLVASVCPFYRVTIHGQTLLAKMLNLTFLGDFVSLYLAALNGVDPENIDSINILKNELSQVA